METKTTPVHPLLLGTTTGEWNVEDSEYSGITNKVVAGETMLVCVIQPGPIGEVEANAKLIAQAPSLAAENALLAEQNARLREALDKDVARFDGILGDMPRLARMTPTERMSYDAKIAAYRNEAREVLTSLTPASK